MTRRLAEALDKVEPLYEIPGGNIIGDVLEPAMTASRVARIAAGFFSSQCLAQIAPGLASFINQSVGPLQLLISPEISSEDLSAIERGIRRPEEVISSAIGKLFSSSGASSSALVRHTLDCLSYLVATERLEIRFVLMARGMFHKKLWLFNDGFDWAAVHGSGNATERGLLVNGEQMTVDRPWADGPVSARRVKLLVEQWDRQWENRNSHSLTVPASHSLSFVRRSLDGESVPTVEDFWAAWMDDNASGLEPELPPGLAIPQRHVLRVPPGMEWEAGTYAHQKSAVDSLLRADGRGVLQIATGGGKTKTALIAATQLQGQLKPSMLVVVLVPSKPLMLQWAEDVREFGVEPILPGKTPLSKRRAVMEELRAALRNGERRTEVVVATNRMFSSDPHLSNLVVSVAADVQTMLVGDEMHNLGVPSFIANPPSQFHYRIGLSATPVRQYDPDGTDLLFEFFGAPVYEFSLGDAINSGCLTPYRYELHPVRLSDEEMEKYEDLTDELRVAGFRSKDEGQTVIENPRVERLLRERRSVLENADAKLETLRALLRPEARTLSRAIIYASAKPKTVGAGRQIDDINSLLAELGIVSHQFTSVETSRRDARRILDQFAAGEYQVLSAMKVLDEGIDIPQTDTAFLLASSTVTREWVQRRGRILRRSPGKVEATLHDFLVVPPDPGSHYGRSVLRGELRRAEEFVSLASNEWETGGPRSTISLYE